MIQEVKPYRIDVVDALRGFAIACIILLHNMEHFEFYYAPKNFPEWLTNLDTSILSSAYFLFGGKAYAIFALLFGFSFYIQNENQKKKGNDFRLRFFWRMMLLLIFGIINTAFYQGDILTMYAVLGLILIPVCNLSNKAVFWIALLLMLQPWESARYSYIMLHPQYIPEPNLSISYYKEIADYMTNGGFWDYILGDITKGKAASLLWSWENGRFFQAPALFMFGMLAGRKQLFTNTIQNIIFWKKALKIAIISFCVLFAIVKFLPELVERKAALDSLLIVISSWSNLAFMIIWTASFILLFYSEKGSKLLSKLSPMGQMSLTCYLMQSIIGAVLYYKYGFGLYQYTGVTFCLFIGIALLLLQLQFCKWWLKSHTQGPLEKLWHKLTWMKI
ncbi:DUF418 domain-containing protein [Flavobacterium sp. SUN052]|uniref:DUF418 domain-containing protein n=1 Tax=Flavobacterium sp. SUN052 TaxID=3002441 RepID=UPI00237DF047|nr:DUF418 domain-containing protein [Flavobacterium sp. SUN052]MEC4003219.1 DUF418 domain-containing protein [Flavobacterium sp. SUN052]